MSLNDYKDVVKRSVAYFNDEDEGEWRWSSGYCGKKIAHIGWGYLDYLESNKDFTINLERDDSSDEWIIARDIDGELIDMFLIENEHNDSGLAVPMNIAVKGAVAAIRSYAKSRY